MKSIPEHSLYFVSSQEYSAGRPTHQIIASAIEGGVDIVQLREKTKTKPELIGLAKEVSTWCRKSNILFIVNDDPYIAREAQADGVHLGQEDIKKIPVLEARRIVGKDKLIGLSTHSLREVRQAQDLGVDYIAFGPIFPTQTKNYSIGTEYISQAREISQVPVVFIGGINPDNIYQVLSCGAKTIAVIRAISQAEDVLSQVKSIKETIGSYREAGIYDHKS